jgi:transglutaminase-like putative cysteine protease
VNALKTVDDYIRQRFIYTPEMIETLLTPDYMLAGLEVNNHLTGDCDDISIFHGALLTAMNIKVRIVAIRSTFNDPNYDHVFIEAFNGQDWLMQDATVPLGTTMEHFASVTMNV